MKPVAYTTQLKKFDKMGEKTGWTYIEVPAKTAEAVKPGCRKSFRVKLTLDGIVFDGVSMIPMGEGNFIIAINGDMRKAIKKQKGHLVEVALQEDKVPYQLDADFLACLVDAPEAKRHFESFPRSHQNYYSKWIQSAKTESTKVKRIAQAIETLGRKMNYAEMIRYYRDNKPDL